MTPCIEFDEISVLIPGYSPEDLPSDLDETRAASLLNAAVTAWHPSLLALSRGVPHFRQAESLNHFSGRNIFLVPAPAEDWMPHEWQQDADVSSSIAIGPFTDREEWVDAIAAAVRTDQDAARDATEICCVDDFYALGLSYLLVIVLSRRMHHFIDPDDSTLEAQVHLAATAALAGDEATTREHLQRCFDSLRETREQFYPLDCCLVDLCVPPSGTGPQQIRDLALQESKTNVIATAGELHEWCTADPGLADVLAQRQREAELTLITGGWSEQRPALGSMLASRFDLQRGQQAIQEFLQHPADCWGRKRFGLTAGLPTLLQHCGFEFALHFALDDGSYPEQEHSWFEWEAGGGSRIPATSRIPLAIDSAASVLRFPDRCRESMQDDASAVLLFARLPQQMTCWPADLRRIADWAPVFGRFVTLTELNSLSGMHGTRLRFRAGEYLSPHLIQAAVLRNEPPIAGPATLHLLWSRLATLQLQQACVSMLGLDAPSDSAADALRLQQLTLNELEREHTGEDALETVRNSCTESRARMDQLAELLASRLQQAIPVREHSGYGLLLQNTLPVARVVCVDWPRDKRPPRALNEITGFQVGHNPVVFVKLPPMGFVWLTEAGAGDAAAEAFRPPRREPPLAEPLALRNRFFEVSLSPRSGGIAAVTPHGTRQNLLSQRPCFRFDRSQKIRDADGEEIGSTSYSDVVLVDTRVVRNEPLIGEVEVRFELRHPTDNTLIAAGRQSIQVDRYRPRIRLSLQFDDIQREPGGNPWLCYLAARFAWDDPLAVVSRGIMGQASDAESERLEAPDYLEIAGESHRTVIIPHGRPYHRRSGEQMIDSLLMVEGDEQRSFEFTIEMDQAFPMLTAQDAVAPPVVRETGNSVPAANASGWLMGVNARNVMIIGAEPVVPAAEGDIVRVRFTLMETEGAARECILRTARVPAEAQSLTGKGRRTPLPIQDGGVVVVMDAFGLKDVELTFQR